MIFATEDGWTLSNDDTFVSKLGQIYVRRYEDGCELGLFAEDHLKNLSGLVHGGALMALLDRAGGITARAATGDRVVTASMTVNFLQATPLGTRITIRCRIRKTGRRSLFTHADAFSEDTLVATATGIFMRV